MHAPPEKLRRDADEPRGARKTPVIAAGAEVGRGPEHALAGVTYGGGDFVDETLILEEHHLGFAIRIVIFVPAASLLIELQ